MRRSPSSATASFALSGLLAAAALGPAAAQQRQGDIPALEPTRDVAVTYRMEGDGERGEMQMSWLAAERRLRIDVPERPAMGGGGNYMIVDRGEGRALMVMERQRVVMEMPLGPEAQAMLEPSANARFTREGTDSVAGHACTIWSYEDGPDNGRACVTDDGVMLRAIGSRRGGPGNGGEGRIEATQVAYGAQDPARFRPPTDYRTMRMPLQPPASPGGDGGGAPGTNSALPPPGLLPPGGGSPPSR